MKRLLTLAALIGAFLLTAIAAQAVPSEKKVVEFRGQGVKPGDTSLATTLLKDDELYDLSLVDLTLLRDGIYGRHGQIFREAWVEAYFNTQPWYKATGKVAPSDLNPIERKNAVKLAEREQRFSSGELRSRIDTMEMIGYTEEIEKSLLKENLQRLEAEEKLKFKQLFTLAQLRKMSKGELSVLRNEIFARHGYRFKDQVISEYFKRTPWYKPNARYTDALLTSVDQKNILLITQVEKEKGGALQEVDRIYGGA